MDLRGNIWISAPNVTIKNSVIRGRADSTRQMGLITNDGGFPGLLIEDTTIAESAANPNNMAGILGSHFVARRVTIIGQVDSIYINGSDVTVEDSELRDTVYYAHHFTQNDGPTHNDGIQIRKGDNITIRGNSIHGSPNFEILAAAETGTIDNLLVENNYLNDGWCTSKFASLGHSTSGTIRNNSYGPSSHEGCPIQVTKSFTGTFSNNVWKADGTPVPIMHID